MTAGIILAQPLWLWLLPTLVAVLLLLRWRAAPEPDIGLASGIPRSGTRLLHPYIELIPRAATGHGGRATVEQLLRWAALACLVLALAEPVRIGERLPDPPDQRDIMFVVDVSVSMTLRDYVLDGVRIDRMNLLKALLARFTERLSGERIGIIAFADRAHTLVPLTPDQGLLQRMIERLDTGIAGRSTAVGEAVALGVQGLSKRSDRQPVLVLFTDAVQPTGRIGARQAAGLAAKAGIPLYTVAIGAASYAAEEQRVTGLIYHPADVALLAALSEQTGAKSYRADDGQTLAAALTEIGRRETPATPPTPRYYRLPLYHWALLTGLALLTLAQLRRVRLGSGP